MLPWLLLPALAVDIAQTVPIAGQARTVPIAQVVIHATGGPSCDPRTAFKGGTLQQMVDLFSTRTDGVSIHYIVGDDGRIVAMVPEDQAASHAFGHNRDTIGIEVVNDGDGADPYPQVQQDALAALVADILGRRDLEVSDVVTHDDIDSRWFDCAPGPNGATVEQPSASGVGRKKKVDPGEAFPWDAFTVEVGRRLEAQ